MILRVHTVRRGGRVAVTGDLLVSIASPRSRIVRRILGRQRTVEVSIEEMNI